MITLTGETDLVSVAGLSALLSGQLAAGTRELTIGASGLRCADTASRRGAAAGRRDAAGAGRGRLVLLHPQRPVARMLGLPGADQMLTIGEETRAGQRPTPAQDNSDGRNQPEPRQSRARRWPAEHGDAVADGSYSGARVSPSLNSRFRMSGMPRTQSRSFTRGLHGRCWRFARVASAGPQGRCRPRGTGVRPGPA